MIETFSDKAAFLNEWRQYKSEFTASGLTAAPYLQPEFIREQMNYAGFDENEIDSLRQTAKNIAARPNLSELFAFTVYHLQHSPFTAGYGDWPDLKSQLGPTESCFYLLAALTLIPVIREKYRALGIPETVNRDTTLEFSGFYRNHIKGCGVPGIFKGQVYWLKLYRDAQLFRLGRMEYKAEKFGPHGIVLRQQHTGQTVMLAADGNRYDGRGLALAADAPADGWKAICRETPTEFTGHPIRPDGRAEALPVSLTRTDWEVVLRPGDDIIDMHIPPGGGMTPDVCGDSMRQAAEFFPALLPARHFKAIYCNSWIFNPQLEERLPVSNLAKFMRELYLFPVPGDRFAGMFFVFCRSGINEAMLPSLPRETSLQRVMLEILESGEDLRYGAMFYLAADLEHFGMQYYRHHFPGLGAVRKLTLPVAGESAI